MESGTGVPGSALGTVRGVPPRRPVPGSTVSPPVVARIGGLGELATHPRPCNYATTGRTGENRSYRTPRIGWPRSRSGPARSGILPAPALTSPRLPDPPLAFLIPLTASHSQLSSLNPTVLSPLSHPCPISLHPTTPFGLLFCTIWVIRYPISVIHLFYPLFFHPGTRLSSSYVCITSYMYKRFSPSFAI